MTPEERQLIASLFDRLRRFGRPEKDEQANGSAYWKDGHARHRPSDRVERQGRPEIDDV